MDASHQGKVLVSKIREIQQFLEQAIKDHEPFDFPIAGQTEERVRSKRDLQWCQEILRAFVWGADAAQSKKATRSLSVEP